MYRSDDSRSSGSSSRGALHGNARIFTPGPSRSSRSARFRRRSRASRRRFPVNRSTLASPAMLHISRVPQRHDLQAPGTSARFACKPVLASRRRVTNDGSKYHRLDPKRTHFLDRLRLTRRERIAREIATNQIARISFRHVGVRNAVPRHQREYLNSSRRPLSPSDELETGQRLPIRCPDILTVEEIHTDRRTTLGVRHVSGDKRAAFLAGGVNRDPGSLLSPRRRDGKQQRNRDAKLACDSSHDSFSRCRSSVE